MPGPPSSFVGEAERDEVLLELVHVLALGADGASALRCKLGDSAVIEAVVGTEYAIP